MIPFRPARFIPFPLVNTHHFPRMTRDAAVRKEVRWIRENHVEPPLWILLRDGIHHRQAVIIIQPDPVFRIFINQVQRRRRARLQHHPGQRITPGKAGHLFHRSFGIPHDFFLFCHWSDRSIRRSERSRENASRESRTPPGRKGSPGRQWSKPFSAGIMPYFYGGFVEVQPG